MYIDINEMVSGLQTRYKEYARRKRHIFRQSVQKGRDSFEIFEDSGGF